MGAAAGGVSVKTQTDKYEITKIVKDLCGSDLVKTEVYQDTRYPEKYYVEKTKDVITIYNNQFVDKFYLRQDTRNIQYFIDYFQKPELIFAHEKYDSGGTYSYALIYNGVLKRQFRSLSYKTKIDFGEPENVEIGWKNGKVSLKDLGAGEFETIIKNNITGKECDETNIPIEVLNQLQFDKLGFDDDPSKIIDKAYFIKAPESKKISTNQENQNSNPWWKYWYNLITSRRFGKLWENFKLSFD